MTTRHLPAALRGGGLWGLVTVALLALAACLGPPLLARLGQLSAEAQDLALGATPPSSLHLFGTDRFGRDLLMRTLLGLRLSLSIAGAAGLVSVGLGTLYGSLSAYLGGRTDAWMMRAVDVLYALPFVFLVILLTCVFGRSLLLLFVGLGAVSWLTCARVVRAHILGLVAQDFVAALQIMGAGHGRIWLLHLVPNSLGVVVIMFTLGVPTLVLEEAFLSFVGLGVQAPAASLGSLLQDGATQMLLSFWPLAFPAITLAVLLLALNAVGDALQRALDPRTRP